MPRAPQVGPSRNWIAVEHVDDFDEEPCFLANQDYTKFFIFGKEIAPSTGAKHYQCYFQLKEKKRLTNLKKIFNDQIHFEAALGSVDENIEYCSKEGQTVMKGSPTRVGERTDLADVVKRLENGEDLEVLALQPECMDAISRCLNYFRMVSAGIRRTRGIADLRARMESATLRPWQSELLSLAADEPHPRHVIWTWDFGGNTGKSFMADYLVALHGAIVFTHGKVSDIAHAYNFERVVIFDLSRTQADKLDGIFMAIENFKNGRFFSPKYESQTKVFSVPHVFVFSNFDPDRSKLSADRWKVNQLD